MSSLQSFGSSTSLSSVSSDNRRTQSRVRIRIPKRYQQEPVISKLVSDHGLTINIAAALLSANACEDGWFDLEVQGTVPQIQSAMLYLNELALDIWHGSDTDGW